MKENKGTILVVDDEEYIRRLIERILDEAGYAVITAAGGREALDKLSPETSLVLLDIRMPDLNGIDTLELIRKQYTMPVIMVTGLGEVTLISDALSKGADDYVKKPFQARELIARIEAKLRRVGKTETRVGEPDSGE